MEMYHKYFLISKVFRQGLHFRSEAKNSKKIFYMPRLNLMQKKFK